MVQPGYLYLQLFPMVDNHGCVDAYTDLEHRQALGHSGPSCILGHSGPSCISTLLYHSLYDRQALGHSGPGLNIQHYHYCTCTFLLHQAPLLSIMDHS